MFTTGRLLHPLLRGELCRVAAFADVSEFWCGKFDEALFSLNAILIIIDHTRIRWPATNVAACRPPAETDMQSDLMKIVVKGFLACGIPN